MPIIDMLVPPSLTPTRVLAWVCVICAASTVLVDHTDGAAIAEDAFEEIRWALLPPTWRHLPSGQEVVCDRCKTLPDVAHQLLAAAKAVTQ